MWAIYQTELKIFLRSRRAFFWVGALQFGLLWFIVSIWPDTQSHAGLAPDYVSRIVIYDFMEKLLWLLLLITPVAAVSAFARETPIANLHLLLLTNAGPWAIVFGKLAASLTYLTILLICSLPALALVMQVGGVPLQAVLLLYGFFLVTMLYFGSMACYLSLRFGSTARALVTTYAMALLINFVFPSFQLYTQMLIEFFSPNPVTGQPGGFASGQRFMDLFPNPENLYSTPDMPIYYAIDLFSPYSVYCNFRFVQLKELSGGDAMYYIASPRAAGDFQMVYHYIALALGITIFFLTVSARRLKYLTIKPVAERAQLRAALEKRWFRSSESDVIFYGFIIGFILRCTVDLFDVYPGRTMTVAMMWIVALIMGNAGAAAIAPEREKRTLRLLAASNYSTRELFNQGFDRPFKKVLLLLSGFILALTLTSGTLGKNGLLYGFLKPAFGDHLQPLFGSTIALSAGCIIAAALFGWGIGLFASCRSRTFLHARLVTFCTIFGLWVISTITTGEPGTIKRVLNADLGSIERFLLGSVAIFKDGALLLIAPLNPFDATAFASRSRLDILDVYAPWQAWLSIGMIIILALFLQKVAQLHLMKKEQLAA